MQYLKLSLHKQAVLKLESIMISPEAESLNIEEKVAENPPFRNANISPIFLSPNGWTQLRIGIWSKLSNNMFSGPLWKGGSAAISEYKCSRIAQIAAMGRKGDFTAEETYFQRRHHLLEFGSRILFRHSLGYPSPYCNSFGFLKYSVAILFLFSTES
jgi:hypothetical protein